MPARSHFRGSLLAVLLFLCIGSSIPAVAQQIQLKHYGQEDGLNNQVVTCLLQDRTGFIWVGTQSGLFRYDGKRFERYGISEGLPSPSISALHQDRRGNFWAQTESGLARMVEHRFKLEGPRVSLSWVGSAEIDSAVNGTVYFATPEGLGIAEPSTNSSFHVHVMAVPESQSQSVHAIYVDTLGAVWFSTDTTLDRLQDGRIEVFGEKRGVPRDRCDAILADKEGNLWIRCGRRVLVKDANSDQFRVERNNLTHSGDIDSLLISSQGDLLVPTRTGLQVRHNRKWRMIDEQSGNPTVTTSVLMQDREGSIWWGTWGGGLHRWLGYQVWQSWTRQQGLSGNLVWQIRTDPKGTTWAATDNGLSILRSGGEHWQPVGLSKGGEGSDVRTFVQKDDLVWTGSAPGGIHQIDPSGKVAHLGFGSPLWNANVFRMELDTEQQIWIASDKGLFRSSRLGQPLHFEQQLANAAESKQPFYTVFVDTRGRVWAAGNAVGLACFDHGRWKVFTESDGLLNNNIRVVTEDHQGALWVGYEGDFGLSRMEEQSTENLHFRHYSRKNGLCSEAIVFLGCDRRGWIWSGTDNGIDVYDGVRWKHFGMEDGLVWNDCDTNGFLQDANGNIWIGTSRGLAQMISEPPPALLPPVISMISGAVGSQLLNLARVSTLPFHGGPVRLSFAALTFTDEANVSYRYRLQGLSNQWFDTDSRSVEYPSLGPGTYLFEVLAKNTEGSWSKTPAVASFEVLTPWWLSLWTKLGAVVLLAWGCYLSFMWRMRKMNQHNLALTASLEDRTRLLERANQMSRLKSEFLANMSHEIRTPLHGIMALTQLTLDSELLLEQRDNLDIVNDSAASLLLILNDILDISKIEANCLELEHTPFHLPEVLSELLKPLTALAQRKGLFLHWEIDTHTPSELVGDPTRLRQILTNLISNAIKFTSQGEIRLVVKSKVVDHATTELSFAVSDTGIGIAPEKQASIFEPFVQADGSMTRKFGGTGLGLSICSKLVSLLGGRIWVTSEMGEGSTFHFTALSKLALGQVLAAGTMHSDEKEKLSTASALNVPRSLHSLPTV